MTGARWRTIIMVILAAVLAAGSNHDPPELTFPSTRAFRLLPGESASVEFGTNGTRLEVQFDPQPGLDIEPTDCDREQLLRTDPSPKCIFRITVPTDAPAPGRFILHASGSATKRRARAPIHANFNDYRITIDVLQPTDQLLATTTTIGFVPPITTTTVSTGPPGATCDAGEFTVILDPAVVTTPANGFGRVLVQVDGQPQGEVTITLEGDQAVIDAALPNLQPPSGQIWELFIDRISGDFPLGTFDMAVNAATGTANCSAPFLFVVEAYGGG